MNNLPPSHRSLRQQGVALVLVLCFVVLITGLVVAYFSRTLTTRQLSNASTSTAQAEMLANSATDIILGDLKQEIANPIASVASTPPPAALPAGSTVYAPTQARYAVPQRNASPAATPATPPAPAVGPIPNLVRRSLRTDATSGGANYVPPPGLTSRASAASSSAPSANSRFVTTARWNRHYLIPTAAATSSATSGTDSTPIADFTPPDWVFVTAEKGPASLSSPFKDASGGSVTTTGRYAYAIYDEGGLLDTNHTGFPSVSTASHIGAKPAPSYADLTQLGMLSQDVDYLLGWRQYATLQSTGAFPKLQPSATLADTAYYNLFTSGPANLSQVPLTVWNNKTDQTFLSRQQLIGYFAAAGLDTRYLQYLGTFSRGLNQPSYLPEHSSSTLDPSRPKVLDRAAGGNDSDNSPGITPNFLTARVVNVFDRYDGTKAIVGEPLVKKRFPLNRLAWLTYQGPSADRNTAATALTGPDADIGYLKQNGITKEWLDQGTDDKVATYFGLRWGPNPVDPNRPNNPPGKGWTYIHGFNGSTGPILNVSNALKSTDVARQSPGREPDFFELLKASINPGSIAKSSLSASIETPANPNNTAKIRTAQNQRNVDISLDAAILQIGANIIDQFDTDGFPTRINYDLSNAALSGSVYGIENLPYISRVRAGLIRLQEAVPGEADASVKPTDPIKNTGVGALMNYPEIWNPHDWSSANLPQSAGAVGPRNFKIYAVTNNYNGVPQATSISAWQTTSPGAFSFNADPAQSPGFAVPYGFSFGSGNNSNNAGGEARLLSEMNTVMTFSIDPTSTTSEALFREPTILYKPGTPTGSQLVSPALVSTNGGASGLGSLATNPSFFGPALTGGLKSAVSVAPYGTGINGSGNPLATTSYIGFYLGAHPLRWWDKNAKQNVAAYQTLYGPVVDVAYTLACDDGNGGWISYDIKPVTSSGPPDGYLYKAIDNGFGLNGTTGPNYTEDFGVRYYITVDPRGTRFGVIDPWIQSQRNSISPREQYSYGNSIQGTLKSDREGINSGAAIYFGPLNGDPYGSNDWFSATMGWYHDANLDSNSSFRPGLLSQNNPNVTPDGFVSSGLVPTGTNVPAGTYYSPFYYADADGVVRRASAGNVKGGSGTPASASNGLADGLPMAYANAAYGPLLSTNTKAQQIDSRPVILNRPFRSVTELGYAYSGTPWKNLDFFLPESGDVALLDVFCVNDNSDANAMSVGQVNLNTHQVPVLQAILAQANKDQWNDASTTAGTAPTTIMGSAGAQAQQIAQVLVNRTVSGPKSGPTFSNGVQSPQPLQSVSDLVGRWVRETDLTAASGSNTSGNAGINGQASYDGFTADLVSVLDSSDRMHNIQRFGEGAVRALSNAGQTRVWNLMFDIVAQTGRFIPQATSLDQFNVEGEQHYWVHVAIDRYTGQILDKQVEVVKE